MMETPHIGCIKTIVPPWTAKMGTCMATRKCMYVRQTKYDLFDTKKTETACLVILQQTVKQCKVYTAQVIKMTRFDDYESTRFVNYVENLGLILKMDVEKQMMAEPYENLFHKVFSFIISMLCSRICKNIMDFLSIYLGPIQGFWPW